MEWFVQVTVGLRGYDGTCLLAKIATGQPNDRYLTSNDFLNFLQVLEGDLALALKDLINKIRAGDCTHVPLRDIAYPSGILEPRSWNETDIPKRSSRKTG